MILGQVTVHHERVIMTSQIQRIIKQNGGCNKASEWL